MFQKKIKKNKSANLEISKKNQLIRKGIFFKSFILIKSTLDKMDKNK